MFLALLSPLIWISIVDSDPTDNIRLAAAECNHPGFDVPLVNQQNCDVAGHVKPPAMRDAQLPADLSSGTGHFCGLLGMPQCRSKQSADCYCQGCYRQDRF